MPGGNVSSVWLKRRTPSILSWEGRAQRNVFVRTLFGNYEYILFRYTNARGEQVDARLTLEGGRKAVQEAAQKCGFEFNPEG